MKTIKKIKNNLGKVTGSALLVGATVVAGGAALAQDSGSSGDLSDYPAPFVTEDGEVDTSIVVGETAQDGEPVSTLDVVAGLEIAGSLGNAAFTESTESVSVEGSTASWSAENGITLDRRNSPIFFGQPTDSEENRLDDQDLDVLSDTTFSSDDSEDVTVEHTVKVGNQPQDFDSDRGDVDDPVLHVENPTTISAGDESQYLMQAEVEFDETIDFTETDTDADGVSDNADEVLEDGETIEMFGQDFEYSDESTGTELVFYGSSQSFSVGTNDDTVTETVDGNEVTFGVTYVPSSEEEDATVTVDGQTETVSVGDTIDIDGTEVRITDFFKRAGDEGLGSVEFSIGSDEVTIDNNGDVEVGGDTVDAVEVGFDSSEGSGEETFDALDGMQFAFGAEDSDVDLVQAGEMYEDPLFGLQFHYGGLTGNVVEDPADVFEVNAVDDGDAEFTFTADGEETTVTLGETDNSGDFNYGPGDEYEKFAQYEGQALTEDDYVTLNSNEEADMYEVTSVDDTDLEDAGSGSDDETVSVTLNNVVTGESVEIEEEGLDFDSTETGNDLSTGTVFDSDDGDATPAGTSGDTYTLESESVEGKDYDITFHQGNRVSFERTTAEDGHVQLWPHLYTDSDAAVAIDAPGAIDLSNVVDITAEEFADGVGNDATFTETEGEETTVSLTGGASSATVELRTGEGGSAHETVTITDGSGTYSASGTDDIEEVSVTGADGTVDSVGLDSSGSDSASFTVGTDPVTRTLDLPSGVASNDAEAVVEFSDTDESVSGVSSVSGFVQYGLETTQSNGNLDASEVNLAGSYDSNNDGSDNVDSGDNSAAVLVTQPEDDNDNEGAYAIEAFANDGSQDVEVDYAMEDDFDFRDPKSMDDEEVDAAYDFYGAYSMLDEEDSDEDVFTLHLPAGQSSAGLAVTGADGSLSASGGSASGSVTSMMPTYSFADGVLDSDSDPNHRAGDDNLILVGGPSVNQLVADLAEEGETMTASEYTEGEGMIQHIPNYDGDRDAVIVAGYSGEDTRAAGEFLADYRDNGGELEGNSQVTISTETGQVVN